METIFTWKSNVTLSVLVVGGRLAFALQFLLYVPLPTYELLKVIFQATPSQTPGN